MTKAQVIDRAVEAALAALVVLIAVLVIQGNAFNGATAAFSQWYANLADSFLAVDDLVVDVVDPDGYQRLTASHTDGAGPAETAG